VTAQPWAEVYIGLPYRDMGRDLAGVDCWGLVRLVLRDQCGIDLEGFEGGYSDPSDRARLDGLIRGNLPFHSGIAAGAERVFDVAFFRQHGHVSHCGVICGRGVMIHSRRGTGVCVESYRSGLWGNRLHGIYRHKEST
jgi:cell wall-associated NlpC family hydrolase